MPVEDCVVPPLPQKPPPNEPVEDIPTTVTTALTTATNTTNTTTVTSAVILDHDHDHATTTTTITPPHKVDPSVTQLQQRIAHRNQQQQHQRHRRRSATSNSSGGQDPIIAPGFGTHRDLARLARELSLASAAAASDTTTTTSSSSTTTPSPPTPPIFTVESIQYLMERRGRGLPKSDGVTSTTNAATTTTTAWDDFMKEAGITTGTTTTTNSEAPPALDTAVGVVTGKRGRSSAAAAAAAATNMHSTTSTSSSTATATPQQRHYDLTLLQLPLTPLHRSKKSKVDTSANDTSGGLLLQTGTMDVTLIGRKNDHKKMDWDAPYTLSVPTILPLLPRITKVIAAGHACHALAISTTGTVYGWGRNEQSPLGASFGTNVYQPTLLWSEGSTGSDTADHMGPIYDAAVGKGHTILLSYSGQIMACGYNKSGQCGINHSGTEMVSNFRRCIFSGTTPPPKIAMVACGDDFSIVLDTDGYMYSTGSSEYGQLGNGATGEYFISANKLGFANAQSFIKRTTFCHAPNEKIYGNSDSNTKVVPISNEDICLQQVVCGKHHCIALEANTRSNTEHQQPRVFTWGCGDYGVLGHGIQADEYYPRNVGALSNLRYMTTVTSASEIRIAAGQHCSLLQTSNGHVYYWGKHRSVGEATMRPTLVDALANNGHVVTHIGAGGQTVVCCTQHAQTVGWGQGMYGELGFGTEKKSSSKPSFVPGLEGCHITSLACGYGITLFVVRDDGDAEYQKVIGQLPKLDVEVLQTLTTEAEMNSAGGGTMDDEDDDEEDHAKPTKGRKGKSKK